MARDFSIGEWTVEASVNRLRRGDQVVRLEPKIMQVLVCLAEHAGEVVTREELIARVWSDVFVTDDVLHRAVRELRRVFGETPTAPRYVTRADRPGVWRQSTAGGGVELVTSDVPAGDRTNWSATARGVFYVTRSGPDAVLRHVPSEGGPSRTVTGLQNFAWLGFTVSSDGAHVLYSRWDRRESNIMSIEIAR